MTCRSSTSGFTLVESLIVLGVSSSVLLLTVLSISNWRSQVAYDYFVQEFERVLVYSQQAAILSLKASRVEAIVATNRLSISYYDYRQELVIEELILPDDLSVVRETVITFRAKTGNVNRINRFEFYNNKKQERLLFQYYIGSGRFVKKEEK